MVIHVSAAQKRQCLHRFVPIFVLSKHALCCKSVRTTSRCLMSHHAACQCCDRDKLTFDLKLTFGLCKCLFRVPENHVILGVTNQVRVKLLQNLCSFARILLIRTQPNPHRTTPDLRI